MEIWEKSQVEESVFQQKKLWKELLYPSVILTQVNSLMRALPVNVSCRLTIKTSFAQEKTKMYADNYPALITEVQRVRNLE